MHLFARRISSPLYFTVSHCQQKDIYLQQADSLNDAVHCLYDRVISTNPLNPYRYLIIVGYVIIVECLTFVLYQNVLYLENI